MRKKIKKKLKLLTKAIERLERADTRIKRRNARRQVFGLLKSLKYQIEKDFPLIPKPKRKVIDFKTAKSSFIKVIERFLKEYPPAPVPEFSLKFKNELFIEPSFDAWKTILKRMGCSEESLDLVLRKRWERWRKRYQSVLLAKALKSR